MKATVGHRSWTRLVGGVAGILALAAWSTQAATNMVAQRTQQKQSTVQTKPAHIPAFPLIAQPSSQWIIGKHASYGGILVQAYKAENPLELINPLAPLKYGWGDAEVTPATPTIWPGQVPPARFGWGDYNSRRPTVPGGANGLVLLHIRF